MLMKLCVDRYTKWISVSSKGSNCGAQPKGEKHEKTKKAAREVLIMVAVDSFHCLHTLFYLHTLTQ